MQGEMPLLGNVIAPLKPLSGKEMALIGSDGAALELCVIKSRMKYHEFARAICVTRGHLSNMIAGRKEVTLAVARRAVRVSGCLAPFQRALSEFAVDVYSDPVETEKAALRSRLSELERAA